MTPSKRASCKARMMVRVEDYDLRRAEVRLSDGAIVQVWLVGNRVRVVGGDPISCEEMEILSEKVRVVFSKQEQGILFG